MDSIESNSWPMPIMGGGVNDLSQVGSFAMVQSASQMSHASFGGEFDELPMQLDPSQWSQNPEPASIEVQGPSKHPRRDIPTVVYDPQNWIISNSIHDDLSNIDTTLSPELYDSGDFTVFPDAYAQPNNFESFSSDGLSAAMSRSASGATFSSMGHNSQSYPYPTATEMNRSHSNMSNMSQISFTGNPMPYPQELGHVPNLRLTTSNFARPDSLSPLPNTGHRGSVPSLPLSSTHLSPSHAMKRSISSQSHFDISTIPLHPPKRQRTHSARNLAPKAIAIMEATDAPDMVRVKSSDGTSKSYGVLSRQQPDLSVQKPSSSSKIMCSYCNEVPDGFRGEHELQRHTNLRHERTRKVWVCIDASNDGFLSKAKCKACKEGKEYGAYYNAAAHLRRIHFYPRKRGRKSKKDSEKRGGKAGGEEPPMEVLKANWMREIEVLNTDAFGSAPNSDSAQVRSDSCTSSSGDEAEPVPYGAGAVMPPPPQRGLELYYVENEVQREDGRAYPEWQGGQW